MALFSFSNRIMVLGYNVISWFHISYDVVSILNLDTKLSFQCFMNMDASIDIQITSFISPVSIKTKWNSLNNQTYTSHLSGSTFLSLSLTHLIILLAVRPGWVIWKLLCHVFLNAGGGIERSIWERKLTALQSISRCSLYKY